MMQYAIPFISPLPNANVLGLVGKLHEVGVVEGVEGGDRRVAVEVLRAAGRRFVGVVARNLSDLK
jgi:hypothetical protein